jgi:peptide/nickel transport system substrate-binding protein
VAQTHLVLGILVSLGLLTAVACGAAEEPTPTQPPAAATNTPTVAPAVATPTPTATSVPTPTPTATPKRGGRLIEAGTTDVGTYDVNVNAGAWYAQTMAKVYNQIFLNTSGKTLVCDICTSYEFTDAGKTLVIHLVPGAKFHNGAAITAEDVRYSLSRIMGKEDAIASPRAGLIKEYISDMEVVDPLTLKLHLFNASPALPLFLSMNYAAIYPKGTTTEQLKTKPFGSGPYILKEHVRGDRLVYQRNNQYFKAGLPYVDEYVIQLFADSSPAQLAFLVGRIDLVGGMTADNRIQAEALEAQGKIKLYSADAGCYPQGIIFNLTRKPFDDIRIRQAIHLAIDRKAGNVIVFEGRGTQTFIWPPNGPSGRTEQELLSLPGYRQPKDADLAQAKSLMALAGYADGFDTTLLEQPGSSYERLATFTAAELRKIGINAKLEVLAADVVMERTSKLNYAISARLFCQVTKDSDEMWNAYFITGGSRNWTGYSNPEVDRLAKEQSVELDPIKRQALNRKGEDILLQDLPVAPIGVQARENYAWWYYKGYEIGLSQYTENRRESVWDAR